MDLSLPVTIFDKCTVLEIMANFLRLAPHYL